MRFDDTLDTVLATEPKTSAAAQAAWRQIVDLVGRGRAPADGRAMTMLERIAATVPVSVRAASARALFGARPPAALVRLLALDDVAVAAPVLRSADLPIADWIALLPALSPTARAVLRHRRDLPHDVELALSSFGTVDFVIAGESGAPAVTEAVASPQPAVEIAAPPAPSVQPDPMMIDTGPFVSVGSIALGLPMVAEALRRENDNEAPPVEDGTFRIADVVARLEAFQRRRELANAPAPAPAPMAPVESFRFETDGSGVIRWASGTSRGAVIGLGIARQARPAEPGVDGAAAGAFRRRTRFTDARLSIEGDGAASGTWLISAVPVFDPGSGRFTGYRGSGRRPLRHECPEVSDAASPTSDTLRQFVHELRTPTNAIAGFSEMIEHQMLGPVADVYRDQAIAMRGDAGGLLAAIDDLDTAARIDASALQLRPEPVALLPLLSRIVGELTPLIDQRGARLILPETAGTVLADARAVERLVSRMLGTMIGAATAGEVIAVRNFDGASARIGLSITRPTALDGHAGDAVLAIDDEHSPASLLGTGFAMRLVRNLARELGGAMTFGQRTVTLYLPLAADTVLERAGTV